MASAANIAIADSVPTTRNYPPVNVSGMTAVHSDVVTAATAAGQSTLTLKAKAASNGSARRFTLNFALPVEYTDTTTGNVLVKDVFRFTGEWVVPPGAVLLQRANFEALVRNVIAHVVIQNYVKTGEVEY